MYTIVGKGFGLYGYLPAIIKWFKPCFIYEYKSNIQKRGDIKKFINLFNGLRVLKKLYICLNI